MNQVLAFLQEGNGVAARRRLAALLAQNPEQTEALAETIANTLWTIYEKLQLQPVHDFCRDMELELPVPVVERIRLAVGPRIQRTADWSILLRGVTRERLARECRDYIVHKEIKKAVVAAATLLERAPDTTELDDSALLLARALATLTRDRDRALAVIGHLMKTGEQTRMAAPLVADQFTQMSREFKTVSVETSNQEWNRSLTEAILSFRGFLPGPMEVGEPEVAQLGTFYEEAHACLRAGLQHLNREDFIDALAVLMEYCPIDPPAIKNVAGVEERMFLKLGPRAKLTAVRGLGKLGDLEMLRKSVKSLAKECGLERLKLMSAIMGGLRHADFYPYLHHLLGKVDNRRDEGLVVEALGRIGNPEATRLLGHMLESAVRKAADPVQEQRAAMLLTALGRIARAKGIDPGARSELVKKVIKLTEHLDRKLAFHAAAEMFSVRLDELDAASKQWAADKAVDALWGQPLSQPDTPSVNGWREPMVNTLRRLGSGCLPAVLAAGARHATQFSGAMSALANALEDIGDARAVPLLESMLRTAFLFQEDERQSTLLEEKVVDAATRQVRLLGRDEIVHALLFTLKKVGGDEGIKIILDYADQLQGGRLQSPGQQTINFLVDVKLKQGQLELRQARQEEAAVDEKALRRALAQARGGLLTRKETRIAGIAQLGQLKHPEGAGVLMETLGDKDTLVAGAAHTALAQFLMPLPAEKPYCEFLDALFERPSIIKGRLLERFLAFVNRELPKNPPYDKLLERQAGIMIDDGELLHRIKAAMRRPKERDVLERLESGLKREPGPGAGEPVAQGAPAHGDRLAPQSDMDRKRAYFEARKAWIRGGKSGEPPKPPE